MKKRLGILVIVFLALLFIIPFLYTIIGSFWLGNKFQIKGYIDLFFDCFTFYPMFWNAVLYAVSVTFVQFLISVPCAFGLTYSKFKGKKILYIFYIILMMMPLQVTILPNYIGLRDLGLINTRLGIIIPMLFSLNL